MAHSAPPFRAARNPHRQQLRDDPAAPRPGAPAAPAGATATANPPAPAADARAAVPINPQPTGQISSEAQRVMDSIAQLGRDSQTQNQAFQTQLRSELDAFANRVNRLEQGGPGGLGAPVTGKGNSDAHTGTFAKSGFSLLRFKHALALQMEGKTHEAERIGGQMFEQCRQAMGEYSAMTAQLQMGDASQLRTMITSTNSAGGYLVPPEVSTELIPLLRNSLVMARMGARFLTGLRGNPYTQPSQTGASTTYWITPEGTTSITASDLTFGQLSMSFKTLAALTGMSRQVDDLSNPELEQIAREDLAIQIALGMETQMLNGATAAGKPISILQTGGIQTATSTTVSVAFLNNLLSLLETANVHGKIGILWNSKLRNNAQSLKNAGDFGYLMTSPIGNDAVTTAAMGVPTLSTNLLNGTSTTAEVICANWADILIGMWGGILMEATTTGGDAFVKHQKLLKSVVLCDLGIRNKLSVVGNSNITFAA